MEKLSPTQQFLQDYYFQGEMLPIYTYPDPILRRVSKPVDSFGEELKTLATNMLHTLYNYPPQQAIGLAAPQVGHSLRMFVIDVDYRVEQEGLHPPLVGEIDRFDNLNPRIFINPVFEAKKGQTIYKEGCLSLPGVYEEVCRAEEVTVNYRDLDNQPCTLEASGLLSICLQHENDHLDGIVLLERLSDLKREMLTKKYLKEKKNCE